MKNKITIFSLSASKELAQSIASKLGTEVGKCEVRHFADGEILVEMDESVRGKDVYIIQSTSSPVTENLMEILVLCDALKRASAGNITAVMPYFGYARQDRKAKPRQPITSKLVADLLTVAGVNRVITVDLHAAQLQGFFNIPVDDMQALPLLTNYFRNKGLDDICVVSPDHGGANRARKMAQALDAPVAIIDKRRPKPNVAEVMGVLGDVNGKNCIVIDDMIDTGGTITAGIEMLINKGAKNVFVACTHPVFSGPARERLQNSSAVEVVVTDTIAIPDEKRFPKLSIVSVDSLLAKTIEHVENNLPVSDVFDMYTF
ncbi:MAG: ribose-phosphate pyrophosphokinase [Erysipelotrichaceae bacterium]|nr:ribose-phosphate pyrophosphokinase [Erysipelotrichaceae bacterium]